MSQRTLDFGKRERQERLISTVRDLLDGYVRNAIGLAPHLKRMLLALHARCIAHRFCWPSLRTLATDLGYSTEPEDWPAVKRTMIRHTQALKALGLLIIAPRFDRHDSQTTNVYRIKYQTLKRHWQPSNADESKAFPGMAPQRMAKHQAAKHHERAQPAPVTVSPPRCHPCHPPGVISVTGGVSPVSPRELNLNATKTEAEVRANQTGTAASGGGFGSNPGNTGNPEGNRKPRGWWTGLITRDLLTRKEEIKALFRDAVKAGLITDTANNQVRILALARQTLAEPNVQTIGGLITGRIEARAWNYLHPDRVREAAALVGVELTPERMALIRTPGESGKGVDA